MDSSHFFQGAFHSAHYCERFHSFYHAACVQQTLKKLHLIADFDHTLTTASSQQCHDVVVLNKEYNQEVHDKFHEIMSRSYEDMKDGGNLAFWWKETNNLLVEHSGLTQDMFKRGMKASSSFINLREGVPALIECCRLGSIPFVITSAGITNVIAETLHTHGVSTHHDDHFHIDSNVMEFHSDGRLHRILPEDPVHSNAKKYVHHRAAHIFRRRSTANASNTTTTIDNDLSSSSTTFAAMVGADEIVLEDVNDISSPIHTTLFVPDTTSGVSSNDCSNVPGNISTKTPSPSPSPSPPTTQTYHEEPVSKIAAIVLGDREGIQTLLIFYDTVSLLPYRHTQPLNNRYLLSHHLKVILKCFQKGFMMFLYSESALQMMKSEHKRWLPIVVM